MREKYALYFDSVPSDPIKHRYQIAVLCVVALHVWLFILLLRTSGAVIAPPSTESMLVTLHTLRDGATLFQSKLRHSEQRENRKILTPPQALPTTRPKAYVAETDSLALALPIEDHAPDQNVVAGAVRPPTAIAIPVSGTFVPPVVLSRARVPYPRDSYQRRSEGEVDVLVTLSEAGTLTDATVQKSSGDSALDAASLVAVRGYQFRSAFKNHVPVRAQAVVSIDWRITSETIAESYFLEPQKKTSLMINGMRPPETH